MFRFGLFLIFASSILYLAFFSSSLHPPIFSLRTDAQVQDKVLICGICRNIEKAIPNTLQSIQELGSRFLDYRVIIYENNSTDQTKSLLLEWAKTEPRAIFIAEQLSCRQFIKESCMKIKNRYEKIARARNIVLDVAMKPAYDDFKYVVWADLDFLEPWDVESIVETILHPQQEWDAVLSYGAYDLFALRSPEWPIGFELIGAHYWTHLDELRQQFILDPNDPWKKVYSAFGGVGVYKRESMRGCRYSAVVTQDLERAITEWLKNARKEKNVCFLSAYEHLLLNHQPMELSDSYLKKREQYPDEIGLRLPKGNIVWFSCTPKTTLPWTCEHVPFHASMILRGRDKIFINPKIRSNP